MSPFFIVSLVLFILWFGVFLFSKKTRHEQIIMSVVGLIVAPGALIIASNDYRGAGSTLSGVGIEDILFSFALFGLGAVLYHVLLGRRLEKRVLKKGTARTPMLHWVSHLVILIAAWLFLLLVLSGIYHLPLIQGAIVSGLFIGIYIIADRKDLLADALLSGLFLAVLVFLIEQIFFVRLFPEAAGNFWSTEVVSGMTLAGIPLEELQWAAVVGFTVGPLYEYVRRYRFI